MNFEQNPYKSYQKYLTPNELVCFSVNRRGRGCFKDFLAVFITLETGRGGEGGYKFRLNNGVMYRKIGS